MWQRGGNKDEQKCFTCRCNAKIQMGLSKIKDGVESLSVQPDVLQVRTLQHAITADDKLDFENAKDEMQWRAKKLTTLKEARADASSLLPEKDALAQVQRIKHLQCCIGLLDMHLQGAYCFKVKGVGT